MRKRKKRLAAFSLLLFAGLLFAAVWAFAGREKGVVFYVDGEPVYGKELQLQVRKLRLQVRNEVMTVCQIPSEDFSWDKNYEEMGIPIQYLEKKAVEQCCSIKVMQKAAKERNLVDKIDYPSIEKMRLEENRLRESKKEQNEVFFGSTGFSEEDFYDYFNSNLSIQLRNKMEKDGEITISEEERDKLYEENLAYFNQKELEEVEKGVIMLGVQEKYDLYMTEKTKEAEVSKKKAEVIEKLIREIL